jgi:ATP-dependent helicase HrpB
MLTAGAPAAAVAHHRVRRRIAARVGAPPSYESVVSDAATTLPIGEVLSDILSHLEAAPSLVLEAPPGAGKTTLVPLALLAHASWLNGGKIVVLEPRRLAAKAAARRMAAALGERVGGTVGYSVRGDSAISNRTRVEVVTTGVLLRRLQRDASLAGTAAVLCVRRACGARSFLTPGRCPGWTSSTSVAATWTWRWL